MKCMSCKEEVPSKFASAIAKNICPVCDGQIMLEELKSIIETFKVCFQDSEEFEDEINEWLYSNKNYIKLKPNEMVVDKTDYENKVFEAKFNNQNGQRTNKTEDINDTNTSFTNFAKRAGISSQHKKSIDFIKGNTSGAADPSEFVGGEDEEDLIYDEQGQNHKPKSEEVRQMESLFETNDATSKYMELQKLKKMQTQAQMGAGKFGRSS